MLLLTLALWTAMLILWGGALIAPFSAVSNAFQAVAFGLYVAMTAFFWFLTAYYVSVLICYFMVRGKKPPEAERHDRAAILYTVCNDFQPSAADSCAAQDYGDFHLYILDDSTDEAERAKVDAWADRHKGVATVIRRGTTQGFKAGNMNHALEMISDQYGFFAVADADEHLPPDFLSRAMACFTDDKIAFVQAAHRPNRKNLTPFGRDMSDTISPFWLLHILPRNRFGAVVYMGHGAVIRMEAWKDVGGFPLLTSEDFAFSVRLVQHGWRGVYNAGVICTEDFPAQYGIFRQQQKRYVAGSVEAIHACMGGLLKSPKAGLVEKADMLLWSLPLYVPAIALVYVLVTSLLLPLSFGSWHAPTIVMFGREVTLFPLYVVEDVFSSMRGLAFRAFSVFCALSPVFATLTLGAARVLPMRRVLRLLVYSTAAYMSLMLNAWKGVFRFLRRKGVQWQPTGNRWVRQPWPKDELIVGVALCVSSLLSFNLSGLAVSMSLVTGALSMKWGWDARPVRFLAVTSFALLAAHLVLSLLLSMSPLFGAMPMVFSVHF